MLVNKVDLSWIIGVRQKERDGDTTVQMCGKVKLERDQRASPKCPNHLQIRHLLPDPISEVSPRPPLATKYHDTCHRSVFASQFLCPLPCPAPAAELTYNVPSLVTLSYPSHFLLGPSSLSIDQPAVYIYINHLIHIDSSGSVSS